ncbi:radical SAM domain protein [Aedoeadaptatus nemausensis]|uniref:Radical SAM domain protein n=1 Tax=Aedoeadaptatus nemausensis TaxID=2582829 RepID=A0A6V6XYK7_9FIRM|nr:radical SAM protein [Peptoniphilus nemausensis]CAC9922445.1 radical SAM domain protein [Peptoniphilus nemausensis]
MKGLLVAFNASYVHTNLAVRLLQAVAEREIEILEMTINEPLEQCLAKIAKKSPDFIMYSTYIWNWERIQSIGSYIHKAKPEIRQFLGGPEVSFDAPERLNAHLWIEGILCGEGELSFNVFLDYVNGKTSASSVPGLCYRTEDDISENPIAVPFENLDYLPSVQYSTNMEHRIIYYESMRGCPYHCSYCLSSQDDLVRYRSVEDIKADMEHIFQTGTKLIKFVDRSFHIHRERTKSILNFFIDESPEDMCIHFEMNLEHMSDELINLMNSAPKGRFQIEAGIQSTNPEVNELIHRRTELEKIHTVMKKIDGDKIHVHLDLIVGLPEENLDSFLGGFDKVVPLGGKRIQIGFLKLLPGTELRARAKEFGIVYDDAPPYEVIKTNALNSREVLQLKYFAEIVETYYDEEAFASTLEAIRMRGISLARLFYEMAGKVMERIEENPMKGQNGKYRFFYEELREKNYMDEDLYHAFKWDFYRRENRYIGQALGFDDPELGREEVVAFIKKNSDFIETKDPLKASKNVRGIKLGDICRYINYKNGKYQVHCDERNKNGQ